MIIKSKTSRSTPIESYSRNLLKYSASFLVGSLLLVSGVAGAPAASYSRSNEHELAQRGLLWNSVWWRSAIRQWRRRPVWLWPRLQLCASSAEPLRSAVPAALASRKPTQADVPRRGQRYQWISMGVLQ